LRISTKKLALTSVAYTVTLVAVSSIASMNFNTVMTKAEAVETVTNSTAPTTEPTAVLVHKLTTEEILAQYSTMREGLSDAQASELLYLVGFRGKAHKLAWAIVMRESHAHPTSHNTNASTGDNSYGLFQINMIGSLGVDRRERYGLTSNNDLFNPVINAQVAFKMSSGGDDFGSWGIGPNAYRSGAGVSSLDRLDEYPGVVLLTK